MPYRFEFDPVNKILLGRFEGRMTDESLSAAYEAGRKHSLATNASAGIWDLSSVTEFAVSSEFIRHLASQEPAMADANRPRFVVAQHTHAYGLFRMFQLMGERTRPLLTIVHTRDEALAALGVKSPHLEPLD
jgi:hypothetical protein